MLLWNPIYDIDKRTIINDITLPYFKYVYLYNESNFGLTNIRIQTESRVFENIEY